MASHHTSASTNRRRFLKSSLAAGAVAGFLLVFVFVATQPAIRAHKAEVLRQAIQEVLSGPQQFDTLFVQNGGLVEELPAGTDPDNVDPIWPPVWSNPG